MRGPGGGISPARPGPRRVPPHQVRSAPPDTGPPRGRGPTGPCRAAQPGRLRTASEQGPGPAAARTGHGRPGSAAVSERPVPPCRERREADKRGPALPWASRPAPLLSAAEGETASRRGNWGPGGGLSRGSERCPLGRTASRSPRSRTSPAALLPLLTLLPRCAAAAPRRL